MLRGPLYMKDSEANTRDNKISFDGRVAYRNPYFHKVIFIECQNFLYSNTDAISIAKFPLFS